MIVSPFANDIASLATLGRLESRPFPVKDLFIFVIASPIDPPVEANEAIGANPRAKAGISADIGAIDANEAGEAKLAVSALNGIENEKLENGFNLFKIPPALFHAFVIVLTMFPMILLIVL